MKNTFTDYCGISFTEDEYGNYIGSFDMNENHQNVYGVVHGGMLYTLADTTCGINSRKFLQKPVTLSSDFHFLRNTKSGKVTCTATALHKGRKTAVMQVHIYDDKNTLLCEGTFTFYDVS